MNIQTPASVAVFAASVASIASFDFFDTDDFYDSIFGYDEFESHSIRFETYEYNSTYAPRNLGSMFIFLIIVHVIAVLLLLR